MRSASVVEAQAGGRSAALQHSAHGVDAGGEGTEAVGGAAFVGGRGVEAEAGAGDDAEGALGAHEELVEVGPDGGPGRAAGADPASVGQGDVQPQHHVLDLSVAGGELAGGAAGQPTADGGQGDGLRPVAQREAVVTAQGDLEVIAEGAGGDVEHERRLVAAGVARTRPATAGPTCRG